MIATTSLTNQYGPDLFKALSLMEVGRESDWVFTQLKKHKQNPVNQNIKEKQLDGASERVSLFGNQQNKLSVLTTQASYCVDQANERVSFQMLNTFREDLGVGQESDRGIFEQDDKDDSGPAISMFTIDFQVKKPVGHREKETEGLITQILKQVTIQDNIKDTQKESFLGMQTKKQHQLMNSDFAWNSNQQEESKGKPKFVSKQDNKGSRNYKFKSPKTHSPVTQIKKVKSWSECLDQAAGQQIDQSVYDLKVQKHLVSHLKKDSQVKTFKDKLHFQTAKMLQNSIDMKDPLQQLTAERLNQMRKDKGSATSSQEELKIPSPDAYLHKDAHRQVKF